MISMRRAGVVPDAVFVETAGDRLGQWRDWSERTPQHAAIEIEAKDRPARLDMRCVIGLTVIVSGSDAQRVQAVADRCVQAKAGRVIGAVSEVRQIGPDRIARMVSATDTEGVLAWPID